MKLYELINPSDPYTFYAPNIEVAAVVVCQLSSNFGAKEIGGDGRTPILFGWGPWLEEHGIGPDWADDHLAEIADALDSFLIGGANERADVESMLAELPEEKRKAWRAKRQDRHRSSMSQIGERAYGFAVLIRKKLAKKLAKVTA